VKLLKFGKLKQGSTIGIIALSSPCERVRFEAGLQVLQQLGYKTRVALDPCKHYGSDEFMFSSDSKEARVKALEEFFVDSSVDAIFSARGAYGSFELLSLLNFDLIAKHPKPLVGFSDTTALLMAIYQRTGLITVHGPSIEGAFSKAERIPAARQSAMALLSYLSGTLKNPFFDVKLKQLCGRVDSARGRLIGGNLSVLSAMLSTPWEPDFDEGVLFIEEIGERPYRVHRMLTQMKAAGKFHNLKGVVCGSFRNCEHPNGSGPDLEKVMLDIFSEYNFPTFSKAPFGHEDLNLPVPLGVCAQIKDNRLELLEPSVL